MSTFLGVNTDLPRVSTPSPVQANYRPAPNYNKMASEFTSALGGLFAGADPLISAGENLTATLDTITNSDLTPVEKNERSARALREAMLEFPTAEGRNHLKSIFELSTTSTVETELGTSRINKLTGDVVGFEPFDMSPTGAILDTAAELDVLAPEFGNTSERIFAGSLERGGQLDEAGTTRIVIGVHGTFNALDAAGHAYVQAASTARTPQDADRARSIYVNRIVGAAQELAVPMADDSIVRMVGSGHMTTEEALLMFDASVNDFRTALMEDGAANLIQDIEPTFKSQREMLRRVYEDAQYGDSRKLDQVAKDAANRVSLMTSEFIINNPRLIAAEEQADYANSVMTLMNIQGQAEAMSGVTPVDTRKGKAFRGIRDSAMNAVVTAMGVENKVNEWYYLNKDIDNLSSRMQLDQHISSVKDLLVFTKPDGTTDADPVLLKNIKAALPKYKEAFNRLTSAGPVKGITPEMASDYIQQINRYITRAETILQERGVTEDELDSAVTTVAPRAAVPTIELPTMQPVDTIEGSAEDGKDFLTEILTDENYGKERPR